MSSGTIFVTGATGFLGANLVHALVRQGHEVHATVRPTSDRRRLLSVADRVTFYDADLLDSVSLRRAIQACRPHLIYHLAGHGVLSSQKDRAAITAGNVLATANLLAALEGHDYERLVHAGSSAEYGVKEGPLREDDPPNPVTDYGITKACATLLCQGEAAKGRPVTTVRIFTAYGPWEPLPRLVPYVLDCCRRGQPPQLTSGQQQRDFVFVQDVVELLQIAATHPGVCGRILHGATGKLTSVREVVDTLIDISGASVKPIFGHLPRRAGEPERWQASIEQTTALTGWQPRFDLRTGLQVLWAAERTQELRAA